MSLPKRDGVHDRYYLIHKPDTSPEVLAEADLCILRCWRRRISAFWMC